MQLTETVSAALKKHQAGDYPGAESLYQSVLQEHPAYADALHLYGCLCDETGRTDLAIALVSRAVSCQPQAYPYHYNLANMLAKSGQNAQALEHYRIAIQQKPDYAVAHNGMGLLLAKQGDMVGAIHCYQSAIAFQPKFADPYFNLGLARKHIGDWAGATQAWLDAVRIQPDYADALYNLGNLYSQTQRPEDAVNWYKKALAVRSNNAKIHTNLGSVLLTLGRVDEAVDVFTAALQIDPQDVLNHSNLILAASYQTSDPAAMLARCQQWELLHGEPLHSAIASHRNVANPKKRLRIGYVSADFRQHAAAYWIEPLLEGHHHAGGCDIVCYSNATQPDEATARLKAYAHIWVECANLSDDALANRIRQDAIDILVDLSGHTDGNRLLVFAKQPAPVQVSWFGFPVSIGLKTVQYRFTDAHIDPVGQNDLYYSEKLVRLSRFYAAFRPDPTAPEVGPAPMERNGYVTFASLNNFAKITPIMLGLWADILIAVPASRLLMQSGGLGSAGVVKSVTDFFKHRGIPKSRLSLRGWGSLSDFLALGRAADIALDPYPFNGGVTTCHALWMGLPVVTLRGQSAASRVGYSILSGLNLKELAAHTSHQYRDIAIHLAQDPARLISLRASMRARMSTSALLDGAGLAREAETAYQAMWRAWCAAQAV